MKITVTTTDDKRKIKINNEDIANFNTKQIIRELIDTFGDDELNEILVYLFTIHKDSSITASKTVTTINNNIIRSLNAKG